MKKILALALALMMVLALAACGGNDTPDPSGSGTTDPGKNEYPSGDVAIGDITVDNWKEVVETGFGLSLSLPDGWVVKTAESPNGATNLKLIFTVGGNKTYADFGNEIFAELQNDASGDITKYGDSSKVYTSFSDANNNGISSFSADVDGSSGKSVIINYFDNETTVELTFLRMGNWK